MFFNIVLYKLFYINEIIPKAVILQIQAGRTPWTLHAHKKEKREEERERNFDEEIKIFIKKKYNLF